MSLAPLTPQQSYAHTHAHMAQAASPPNHPHHQLANGHGHSMQHHSPYGAPQQSYSMSFPSDHSMSGSQPNYSQSSQPPTYPHQGYSRSFGSLGEGYGQMSGGGGGSARVSRPNGPVQGVYEGGSGKAQIYTAVYSGVSVYEMELNGIACMRRRSDGWLNATQILKVAGVDKGKRTKVLEKEILTGEHEKVQGGYGKYQGTWISYKRGREFCRQYGVEELLRPLLEYDVASDGTGRGGEGGDGQKETPTKEQAMAANRKRFYGGVSGVPQTVRESAPAPNGGTFFSNISPTTSVALAAMNKAARLNSPAPQRSSGLRRPSMNDAYPGGSQQSFMSEGSMGGREDSGYGTQPNGEPPHKRLRPNSEDGGMAPPGLPNLPLDASMRSATPTEPNESFLYDGMASQPQEMLNQNGEPIPLPPLPSLTTDAEQDKVSLMLDLFAEAGRTDYSTHPALAQLSGEDLNIPLDASANNALHWAATLAKVQLLKLLIQRGANIFRGNAAGQSPLVSAVLVNNCSEQSVFPEVLEVLGAGLVEMRDLSGRTILHHIAVSSGIRGRGGSSKYYLEALLEWLVRVGTHTGVTTSSSTKLGTVATEAAAAAMHEAAVSSQDSSAAPVATAPTVQSAKGPVTLVRFLSHIVNARDKAGNTALNLVARVGNRSIIQQLIEIHADPSLPNYKGVSAKDFGVSGGVDAKVIVGGSQESHALAGGTQDSMATVPDGEGDITMDSQPPAEEGANSNQNAVEDLGQDVISSLTTMLTQSLTSHKETLKQRTEEIDKLNAQIREFSALQKTELEKVLEAKERVRRKAEVAARVKKLRAVVAEKRLAKAAKEPEAAQRDAAQKEEIEPKWLSDPNALEILTFDPPNNSPNAVQRSYLTSPTSPLPPLSTLRTLSSAYEQQNELLRTHASALKSRSAELEGMYRKVVALCTGVEEGKVEESLEGLVAAVESERGGLGAGALGVGEVGRVREFLRKVDGSAAGGVVEG